MEYIFQTSEFGVSDTGLHFLRSGFNYQTIGWKEINSMKIEKGKELHNWMIIFVIGVALLAFGVYLSIRTIDILLHKAMAARNAKMILFLLIPCVGAYFVYNSLQNSTVLRINYSSGKRYKFSLREIIKENRLAEFKSFLANRSGAVKGL